MRRERASGSLDTAIIDLSRRELGALHNKRFANRLAASQDLVLRLDVYKKLERRMNFVNTLNFSQDGDLLVSGSSDRMVTVWDWQSGGVKLSFDPGYNGNIFQAKFVPYTNNRTIVSCASDGQVRRAQILDGSQVENKWLGNHRFGAFELAMEPASPHNFYTCGWDGLVQHFDLRTSVGTPLFTCQSLIHRVHTHILRLNTIAIDPRSPNLFAVGGADEYARLYDIRKYRSNGSTDFGIPVDNFSPTHMIGDEMASIAGLAFSDQSELLVSYSGEFIYLFTKKMGLGPDLAQGIAVMISDKKKEVQQIIDSSSEMIDDHQSATKAKEMESQRMDANLEREPQAYKGHLNFKMVKGVNFFGPKCEYVMSGSDCGRIFIWKKKGGELIRVMKADEHTVNSIDSHPHTTVLASSGIENDIKIWTPKARDRAALPTDVEKRELLTDGMLWGALNWDEFGESSTNGRLELAFNFNIFNSDSSSMEGGESSENEDF